MVYGIIKGHGGEISCYSEPGQGTSFHIYLPALKTGTPLTLKKADTEGELRGGRELILLVDDEEPILDIGREFLSRMGYRVIEARSGEEALDLFSKHENEIDLVLLDLSMPGMGGHQTLIRLRELKPELKIIIASGFSADLQVKDSLKAGAGGFIGKPYRLADMLREVRDGPGRLKPSSRDQVP